MHGPGDDEYTKWKTSYVAISDCMLQRPSSVRRKGCDKAAQIESTQANGGCGMRAQGIGSDNLPKRQRSFG